MKALVITRPGIIELRDQPRPEGAGECVIRVLRAGICGTDLQLLEGYAEFAGVPGHEFVGIVDEAPAADRAWIGRRVVGEINIGCRGCDWCARASRSIASTATSWAWIVTSNKPFVGWGEIFGDDVVAAAMIDRLVHHAEILALKGDSYRLKDRDLARPPAGTD